MKTLYIPFQFQQQTMSTLNAVRKVLNICRGVYLLQHFGFIYFYSADDKLSSVFLLFFFYYYYY